MTYYTDVYNTTNEELISGYFRPVTSFLEVPDDEKTDRSFAVFVDRPAAGVSRLPGQAEIILERKSMASDFRGVPEITNDDYDGTYRHRLVFVEGNVQQTLRKIQLVEETEVLKIVTTISQENVFPDARVVSPTAVSFNHNCLRPDLLPELSEGTESLLLRLTNLCPDVPTEVKLDRLLEDLGIEATKVRRLVETSADGTIEGVWRESETASTKSQNIGKKSAKSSEKVDDLSSMEAEDRIAAELSKGANSNSDPPTTSDTDVNTSKTNPHQDQTPTDDDLRRVLQETETKLTITMRPFEIRAYRIYFAGMGQIKIFGQTFPRRRPNRLLEMARKANRPTKSSSRK